MGQYSDYQLVIVRHGESEWNKLNLFTGWRDCRLSEKGVAEAKAAGVTLKNDGFAFDVAHCSLLTRPTRRCIWRPTRWTACGCR